MTFLLYGATGYTGQLIAEACASRGLRPTLAGRNASTLQSLAERLGLPWVAAPLEDDAGLDRALSGVGAVLHCAGPFSRTAAPMVSACLRTGRHYLDITGEIPVFEACAARDREARDRGVMLMPGVGFDVVPSDCLALHVARRLPGATHLELCIASLGSVSHGTALTALEEFRGVAVERVEGSLVESPLGRRWRTFDFGDGRQLRAVAGPLADVSTAWRSTGIGNLRVYLAVGRRLQRMIRLGAMVAPLVRLRPVARLAQALVRRGGPDATARAQGKTAVLAEATDAAGQRVRARLDGPEAYVLTVEAALACVQRVMAGSAPPGFQTPALAWGPDLVLEVPGVSRTDLP